MKQLRCKTNLLRQAQQKIKTSSNLLAAFQKLKQKVKTIEKGKTSSCQDCCSMESFKIVKRWNKPPKFRQHGRIYKSPTRACDRISKQLDRNAFTIHKQSSQSWTKHPLAVLIRLRRANHQRILPKEEGQKRWWGAQIPKCVITCEMHENEGTKIEDEKKKAKEKQMKRKCCRRAKD